MGRSLLFGLIAGVAGTMIGGIISVVIGKKEKMVSLLLAFAAGMMLAIVCFDLIPEAIDYSNVWTTVCSIVAGGIIVLILNLIVEKQQARAVVKHEVALDGKDAATLKRMSITLLFAIALHNLPEGLVIGSSEVVSKGVLMTIMIGLHNIPEGVAIAAPMAAMGRNKIGTVLMVGLAGAPTIIGAVLGYLIGSVSPLFVAISLGIAAGAMLTVVFSDMLLEAYSIGSGKEVSLVALGSLIVGIVILNLL